MAKCKVEGGMLCPNLLMNWTTKNSVRTSKRVSRTSKSSRDSPFDIKKALFPDLATLNERHSERLPRVGGLDQLQTNHPSEIKESLFPGTSGQQKGQEPLSPVLQSTRTVSISSNHSSPVRVSLGSDQEALFVTIEPGQKSKQASTSPLSPLGSVEISSEHNLVDGGKPTSNRLVSIDLTAKLEDIENQLHVSISDAFDQIRSLLKPQAKISEPRKAPGKQMQRIPEFSEIGQDDYHIRATSELGSEREEMDETAVNINLDSSDESHESFDVDESFYL